MKNMDRKIAGVPQTYMTEIDFMLGSIEECNSEYLLPILMSHGINPNGGWIDIETVPDDVIVDIYKKIFAEI